MDITATEMGIILRIFKDFNNRYNAHNLSKEVSLTHMGTLKILKRLHKQNILQPEQLGKAKFYSINFKSEYTKSYITFLLQKEAQDSIPRIKRWVTELKKLQSYVDIAILFGSVLRTDKYKDVDVLLVFKESKLKQVNEIIKDLNMINIKRIHPVKQTISDFKNNILKKNKALLEALKNGIVLFGYNKYVEVMANVSCR